jgi:hypothetical protein
MVDVSRDGVGAERLGHQLPTPLPEQDKEEKRFQEKVEGVHDTGDASTAAAAAADYNK